MSRGALVTSFISEAYLQSVRGGLFMRHSVCVSSSSKQTLSRPEGEFDLNGLGTSEWSTTSVILGDIEAGKYVRLAVLRSGLNPGRIEDLTLEDCACSKPFAGLLMVPRALSNVSLFLCPDVFALVVTTFWWMVQ